MTNPIKNLFSKDAEEGYVANRNLFCYAAGLTGQNMTYSFQTSWWFYFCTTILRIDSVRVGKIQGAARIWDAVNDPVIGSILDNHRFKNGEKLRPYLILTPAIIGIITLIMFFDFGLSPAWMVTVSLIAYILWDLVYSVQDVALWGMLPLSSPHSHERGRVSQWISIGAGSGGAVASLFQLMDSQNFRDMTGISEKWMIFIGAVIFAFGGELISILAHKVPEQVRTDEKQESVGVLKSIAVLRHNKVLLLISLARLLLCINPSLDWQYFFKSSVSFKIGDAKIDGETSQLVYGALVGIPSVFCNFAAVRIIDKIGGMKRLLILAEIVNSTLRIAAFFIGFTSVPRIIAVMVLMAIIQVPVGMKDIAHRSLTSDSIDYVEWKTGQRTEGISFSMQNLVSKLGSAIQTVIKGYVMRFISYDNTKDLRVQPERFMKAQLPLFILGPVLGSVLYIIAISFVPDNQEQKLMIERELKERREAQIQDTSQTAAES